MYRNKKIAVVIPALNEELSIRKVIVGLKSLVGESRKPLLDDIVVCDNGSTDTTAAIAKAEGARVVYERTAGYGAACLGGISALNAADIVVFVDADNSVAAEEVPLLLEQIEGGADLVIGSRSLGEQERGALTFPQKFGNWLASRLINFLWKQRITDLGPFRAIGMSALTSIDMQDRRYGWTVEMQVKAIQQGLVIAEVPVTTQKRVGVSKISGTVIGTIGAAVGIFGTIFKLWKQEKNAPNTSGGDFSDKAVQCTTKSETKLRNC